MENNYKKNSYGKMSLWQWVLIYIVIAAVAYGLIYYFFFARNGGYTNSLQNQNTVTPTSSAAISQDKILDLSSQNLASIPLSVFSQVNLEELNVSRNNLTGAIQSQVGQLKNLKVLNASYNQMTGVPSEIGQLQNLQVLDLSYNRLTGLPNELGNLANLKTLNLSGNSYSRQDFDYIRNKLPPTVNIITSQ